MLVILVFFNLGYRIRMSVVFMVFVLMDDIVISMFSIMLMMIVVMVSVVFCR